MPGYQDRGRRIGRHRTKTKHRRRSISRAPSVGRTPKEIASERDRRYKAELEQTLGFRKVEAVIKRPAKKRFTGKGGKQVTFAQPQAKIRQPQARKRTRSPSPEPVRKKAKPRATQAEVERMLGEQRAKSGTRLGGPEAPRKRRKTERRDTPDRCTKSGPSRPPNQNQHAGFQRPRCTRPRPRPNRPSTSRRSNRAGPPGAT